MSVAQSIPLPPPVSPRGATSGPDAQSICRPAGTRMTVVAMFELLLLPIFHPSGAHTGKGCPIIFLIFIKRGEEDLTT